MKFDDDTQSVDNKPTTPAQQELINTIGGLRENEEELLVRRAAQAYGLPYINLTGLPIESDAVRAIPEKESIDHHIAGFRISGKNLDIIITEPENVETQAIINKLKRDGYTVVTHLGSQKSLGRARERYRDLSLTSRTHGSFVDISTTALESITQQVHTNTDVRTLISNVVSGDTTEGVTTKIIETILGSAVATKSSDIHIEPGEESTHIRFRQDGILQEIISVPHTVYKTINSRIKILSGMKLTITKDAQDGRFTIAMAGTEIEVRVSTIPGPYGEGIVMRILDPRGLTVAFAELGIEPSLMAVFERAIAKPEGIILTTGPTGSGKTTTLYSFLKYIYSPEIKIITIEDPIEYHLAGIQQTQTDHVKGYDFESGLRAAMRQDPDVIMVGEIRDAETAITAVQAAQTGHLVLSTLHTNSAAGVIPRLLTLGVNPSLLASTLRIAIAQRLVRRLVPETKQGHPPTSEQERIIRQIITRANADGKDLSRFNITPDMPITLYEPMPGNGSETGYHGRVGIFEAIEMDDDIEQLLEKNPSERDVRFAARKQHTLSLVEDGLVKVLRGITTWDELLSVVDIEEDLWIDTDQKNHISEYIKKNETVYIPDKHTMESLLKYMESLEEHQRIHPSEGVADRINILQDMIVDIVKHEHGIRVVDPETEERERVHIEITKLVDELKALETHQNTTPHIGIADELASIRTSIAALQKD